MNQKLGIRREDKNRWEARAPLAPSHVKELLDQHDITTVIQPSMIRIFSDDEYRAAGAVVDEDLSSCNLVVAVKEIPMKLLVKGGRYMYFSHTIKGQSYNMGMLKHLLEHGCTLLDHEKVTDDKGRRLVLFGYHAGLAGMIDSLWALGQRLLAEGHDTPFSIVRQAYEYSSLEDAEKRLGDVGQRLVAEPLPAELGPIVIGITGYGNVSQGAQHILDMLSPKTIAPENLSGDLEKGTIYKVIFKEEHMVAPVDASTAFDLQTYFDHPEGFRSIFSNYLDNLTILVNGIYWEERYPRLVTNEKLRELYAPGQSPQLRVIGDISCDIGGSVEATVKATYPDQPVYVYDPHQEKEIDGVKGQGPVIMAVDNLPCEVARESTLSFGDALLPLLPGAITADYTQDFDSLVLPEPMKRAVIVHRGELTPTFEYLEKFV